MIAKGTAQGREPIRCFICIDVFLRRVSAAAEGRKCFYIGFPASAGYPPPPHSIFSLLLLFFPSDKDRCLSPNFHQLQKVPFSTNSKIITNLNPEVFSINSKSSFSISCATNVVTYRYVSLVLSYMHILAGLTGDCPPSSSSSGSMACRQPLDGFRPTAA